MFSKLILAVFTLSLSYYGFGQEPELVKSSDFFGVSFDIGGGLELEDSKYTSGQIKPSESPNIGTSLFWERHWYFSKNHGLIFGGGINWMAFSNSVNYEYSVSYGSQKSIHDNLGRGLRSSVFSIDLPLYYTYRIGSGIGDFNPYIGVNVRTIAGLVYQKGYIGRTSEIEYNGGEYFSEYSFQFNLSRVAPMIQPTLGVAFVRELKNGAHLNYSIDYKLFLADAFSSVHVSYENTFRQKGGYLLTPDGQMEPVESFPVDMAKDDLRVNMSRFSFGISYSFK